MWILFQVGASGSKSVKRMRKKSGLHDSIKSKPNVGSAKSHKQPTAVEPSDASEVAPLNSAKRQETPRCSQQR
jgi:hypothetical protein